MDYYERIEKVIDYIEKNLSKKLNLEELAKEAFMSKYYFHRMFASLTGTTVMEYIRKRRLGKAIQELNETSLTVLEIALNNGFDSQEVFTRAFNKHFDITPGKYRKIKSKIEISEKISLLGIKDKKRESGIQPKIVVREKINLVGMKLITTFQENIEKMTIANFHNNVFNKRISEIKGIKNEEMKYGICENDYEEDKLFHTACVEVDEDYSVPEGMEKREMPYSRYLIFTHRGSPETIANTYLYIYQDWLPLSGYELSKRGRDLQIYDSKKFTAGDSDFEMEICVPIE